MCAELYGDMDISIKDPIGHFGFYNAGEVTSSRFAPEH
jgi:hypothetical protein